MAANKYKLNWKTETNTSAHGGVKVATTHFGVVYRLMKDNGGDAQGWHATVTVPRHSGIGPQTVALASGVTFAEARKAAQDDATRSGGR
ncbi:hypothetical protein MYRNA_29 [Mycobacterium phage Myrna]|uniref:Uncharacterized protein n=1 Tax=Mycobacterium phage Myrna TaxID=546805 RepID=B5LJ40_9CAUD|nr:gp29 [Mycobacterium phage Myrna]ACH62037.1 hypothetical protein MYRNA_29 [Mycobacterium phage Myrna]